MVEETNGITEAELHAYLDGFLADDRRAAVETWLRAHPQEAARIDGDQQVNGHLRALFNGVSEDPVPSRLAFRPHPVRVRWRSPFQGRWPVMVPVLMMLVGLICGWLGRQFLGESDTLARALVRDAVGAHHVYASDSLRPVELDAAREKELLRWLSTRLGGDIRVPDLAALGYRFLGGRLLTFGQAPAAQLMYQDTAGQRLTLFIVRTGAASVDTPIDDSRQGSYRAFSWTDDDVGCVLTGNADNRVLPQAAKAAYRQLVED